MIDAPKGSDRPLEGELPLDTDSRLGEWAPTRPPAGFASSPPLSIERLGQGLVTENS